MELYKMTFDSDYWKRSFCTKSGNVLGGMIPFTMLGAVVEREFDKMIKSIVNYERSSENGLDDLTLSRIKKDSTKYIRDCATDATIYCVNDYRGYNFPYNVIISFFKNLFEEDEFKNRDALIDERLTYSPKWMQDLDKKYDYDDPFMVLIYRLHHALLLAEEGMDKFIKPYICKEDERIRFDRLGFVNCGNMSIWISTSGDDTRRGHFPFNKRYITPNQPDYEKDHTIDYEEMRGHSSVIVKNHYKSIGTPVDISKEMCELFDVDTCYRHALAYDDITIIIYFVYKRN